MKIISVTAFLFTFFSYASVPQEVFTPVSNVYSPKGFDSTDNSEIVVTGFLPNLCHQAPKTNIEFKDKKIHVNVTSLKYTRSNTYCAEMAVPFLKTIDLGVLAKGSYEIIVNDGTPFEISDEINIANRNDGTIDEFIYPAIDYVEKNYGKRTIKLVGYNPSDCFELDRIEIVSDKNDTYSIMPVLKKVSNFCAFKMTPFTYEMEVPDSLGKDIVLLHIRSMHGNSYNTLFNSRLR